MRIKYEEFRLCAKDWKADAFATRHYTNWKGNPHKMLKNSPEIKTEEVAESTSSTQKAMKMMVNGPVASASKRPRTTALSPNTVTSPSAAHLSKKKKDEHVSSGPSPLRVVGNEVPFTFDQDLVDQAHEGGLLDAPIIVGLAVHSTPPTTAQTNMTEAPSEKESQRVSEKPSPGRNRFSIINPLSRWSKGREGSQGEASPIISAASSTTELVQKLSNAHVSDPDDIIVPTSSTDRLSLFHAMSKSLNKAATSSEVISKPKSQAKARNTAKNLCRMDYEEKNPTHSKNQFEAYWRGFKLPESERQIYRDRLDSLKVQGRDKGKGIEASDLPGPAEGEEGEAEPTLDDLTERGMMASAST